MSEFTICVLYLMSEFTILCPLPDGIPDENEITMKPITR
jgi:hypothetical protein